MRSQQPARCHRAVAQLVPTVSAPSRCLEPVSHRLSLGASSPARAHCNVSTLTLFSRVNARADPTRPTRPGGAGDVIGRLPTAIHPRWPGCRPTGRRRWTKARQGCSAGDWSLLDSGAQVGGPIVKSPPMECPYQIGVSAATVDGSNPEPSLRPSLGSPQPGSARLDP